jgi:hypothetical protein
MAQPPEFGGAVSSVQSCEAASPANLPAHVQPGADRSARPDKTGGNRLPHPRSAQPPAITGGTRKFRWQMAHPPEFGGAASHQRHRLPPKQVGLDPPTQNRQPQPQMQVARARTGGRRHSHLNSAERSARSNHAKLRPRRTYLLTLDRSRHERSPHKTGRNRLPHPKSAAPPANTNGSRKFRWQMAQPPEIGPQPPTPPTPTKQVGLDPLPTQNRQPHPQ